MIYVRVRRPDGVEFDFPEGEALPEGVKPVKGYPLNFSGRENPPKTPTPLASLAADTAGDSAEKEK